MERTFSLPVHWYWTREVESFGPIVVLLARAGVLGLDLRAYLTTTRSRNASFIWYTPGETRPFRMVGMSAERLMTGWRSYTTKVTTSNDTQSAWNSRRRSPSVKTGVWLICDNDLGTSSCLEQAALCMPCALCPTRKGREDCAFFERLRCWQVAVSSSVACCTLWPPASPKVRGVPKPSETNKSSCHLTGTHHQYWDSN